MFSHSQEESPLRLPEAHPHASCCEGSGRTKENKTSKKKPYIRPLQQQQKQPQKKKDLEEKRTERKIQGERKRNMKGQRCKKGHINKE